jgi:hypothetical protein
MLTLTTRNTANRREMTCADAPDADGINTNKPMHAKVHHLVASLRAALIDFPAGVSERSSTLDILFILCLVLLGHAVIPWRQLQLSLGGNPSLKLASALKLGIQLRAEKQREVGDPQP